MEHRKLINLAAALATQCCNGGLYAWSAFVPALQHTHGLSSTQSALIFATTMALFTSTMIVAGPLQARHGPRPLLVMAGALFAIGYLLPAAGAGSFASLLIGLGLLGGVAIGLGYITALSTCALWFPSRCGLVTGIVVAGFGATGLVISQVTTAQLAAGADVLALLTRMGIVYALVVTVSGMVSSTPEAGPLLVTGISARAGAHPLSSPATWVLMIGMFSSTFGGLLIISHLKPLVLAAGATSQVAGWAVGAFALGNATGRLVWGRLADRFGKQTIAVSLLLLLASLLLLSLAASAGTLVAASTFLGICFGAAFVVYAAQVARDHGPTGLALVYPWVFISYGFAGIVGPLLGGWLADATGGYMIATLLAAAVTATGTSVMLLLSRRYVPADSSQAETADLQRSWAAKEQAE